MSMATGRNQLATSLKNVRLHWQRTTQEWKDPVAEEFAKDFWTPLEAVTISALETMEHLEQVFQQMRQDCSES